MTTRSVSNKTMQDHVNITSLATWISVVTFLLVVFNAFPGEVGIYRTATDAASFTPLLAAGFYAALPWLDVWWGVSLALALVLLLSRRWTTDLRRLDLAVDCLGVVVLWRLIFGAPLVLAYPGWGWPVSGWPFLDLNFFVRLALGAALFGHAVALLRKLRLALDTVGVQPACTPVEGAGPVVKGK